MKEISSLPAISLASLLSACSGSQSALNPAGDQADRIGSEWWIFLVVLGLVWGLVMAAMLTGVYRHGEPTPDASLPPPIVPAAESEQTITRWVVRSVVLTVAILVSLLLLDYTRVSAISAPAPKDAMVIKITGHQWWWEIEYQDQRPDHIVKTANEVHIPVGKPVKFELHSVDVIHSFWIPNLHGKRDLIPGHPTSTWFVARREGTFAGQCAEFCGTQHAQMRLSVVAASPDSFQRWIDAQRREAPEPSSDLHRRGQAIFLSTTCILCHSIQGTPARATLGPDLTHFASRQWLGAGTVRNEPGNLANWIVDPQRSKPGVQMPQHPFSPDDLNALLAYLSTLQ